MLYIVDLSAFLWCLLCVVAVSVFLCHLLSVAAESVFHCCFWLVTYCSEVLASMKDVHDDCHPFYWLLWDVIQFPMLPLWSWCVCVCVLNCCYCSFCLKVYIVLGFCCMLCQCRCADSQFYCDPVFSDTNFDMPVRLADIGPVTVAAGNLIYALFL